jgi:hypothetical protein
MQIFPNKYSEFVHNYFTTNILKILAFKKPAYLADEYAGKKSRNF